MNGADSAAFSGAVERHRRELQLHCYRMVGSLEDAEDLAQDTILRAWRRRSTLRGRGSLRPWLYRIATNLCLDFLTKRARRELPARYLVAMAPGAIAPNASELVWLDPYPEHLLDGLVAAEPDPESAVTAKETVELAYLAAIQHLPPRRRAVLILRDVVGWSARETAAGLDMTVAAVNTVLPRARATLRERLPAARSEWTVSPEVTGAERALLRRYMDAHERADVEGLARLVAADMHLSVPPLPEVAEGRDAFLSSVRRSATPGRFRYLPTAANGQPAAGSYVRHTDGRYRPLALDVLRVDAGRLVAISIFLRPDLFAAFGLPERL